jgi:hypothetical protein
MSAHVDHEARLRAALRAAADSLEPRADGLERIRTRLRQPLPAYVAWAQAASAEIVLRTPTWLQDAVYQVTDWLRLAYERFAPAQPPGRHRSRTQGLLRPLAAMAVVMFIVAAGTYVAISASTAIFPSSSSSQPGGPNTGGHSRGAAPGPSHTNSSQGPASTGSRSAAPPSCKPTSAKPGTTSTAPPPAQSANPSPTPTDTSTSTETSSPAPTDSSTTTPPASAAPSASANPPTQPANSPSAGQQPKPSPC